MSLDAHRMEQELAAHSAWVRALARTLVRDEAAAEDLAQDACLAALRHPQDSPDSTRNWLAGVVRRLAWKHHRDAGARRPAAEVGEQDAQTRDPGQLERLERLELHGMLVEELRALREPLRSTLIDRFVYGRSAAEIAQRGGVPAATVRWRLQQGLEELRTRLDARFGGQRETWMSALAFALPSKGLVPVGTGIAIGEGVLMSTLVKVSLGAALLVAAVMLALPFVTKDDTPSVPAFARESKEGPSPIESESRVAALKTPEDANSSRTGVADSEESSGSAATSATQVVARFLDESQHPIANAWLRHVNTRVNRVLIDNEDLARSGADGRMTIRPTKDDPLSDIRLAAGASGFEVLFPYCEARQGRTTDLGDFVLRRGADVRGTVVDRGQNPIAHALIIAAADSDDTSVDNVDVLRSRGPERQGLVHACESGSDGRFLLEGIPVGTLRVWAQFDDSRWSVTPPTAISAGAEVSGIVLVINSEGAADPSLADVQGLVLDPDGKPVGNPHLDVQHRQHNFFVGEKVVGGSDGRFLLHPKYPNEALSFEISAPEDRFTHALLEGIRPGTRDLVVRLQEMKTIVLIVTDEHGPLERFRVRAGDERDGQGRALTADEPHADGHVSVRAPSDSFWYHIDAPAHAPTKLGPIDGRAPPAQLEVALHSVPCVRGRVMDGDLPIAGAKLSLCEQHESANIISGGGFRSYVETFEAVRTTSGADGSFELGIASSGRYSVFADAAGFARAQYGPIQLSADAAPAEIVIPLDAGGTLEGKVLMPSGRSPAGVIVGINRGDGNPLRQTVGADGAFRFERLIAGPWELRRTADPAAPTSATLTGGGAEKPAPIRLREDFTIAVGQTTHKDLDLRESDGCFLEIDLRNNSAPARGWRIGLRPKGDAVFNGLTPQATTDERGHAHLEAPFEGDCELSLSPPVETSSALHVRTGVHLQRGTNSWSRDLATGRIEGVIADWNSDAGLEWTIGGGKEVFPLTLRPDAKGHYVEPLVLVGTVIIQRGKVDDYGIGRETMQTFELASGETKTLQLP